MVLNPDSINQHSLGKNALKIEKALTKIVNIYETHRPDDEL
jgi:hypothetical protein